MKNRLGIFAALIFGLALVGSTFAAVPQDTMNNTQTKMTKTTMTKKTTMKKRHHNRKRKSAKRMRKSTKKTSVTPKAAK